MVLWAPKQLLNEMRWFCLGKSVSILEQRAEVQDLPDHRQSRHSGSQAPERGKHLPTWAAFSWNRSLGSQILCNEELQVVSYYFRHNGGKEVVRQELTSWQTKELQRQLLPHTRKKDKLPHPLFIMPQTGALRGLVQSRSYSQRGWRSIHPIEICGRLS